jgi:hypothetical protein
VQVGYFSKEKSCQDNYNLACILTLPAYQRKVRGCVIVPYALRCPVSCEGTGGWCAIVRWFHLLCQGGLAPFLLTATCSLEGKCMIMSAW